MVSYRPRSPLCYTYCTARHTQSGSRAFSTARQLSTRVACTARPRVSHFACGLNSNRLSPCLPQSHRTHGSALLGAAPVLVHLSVHLSVLHITTRCSVRVSCGLHANGLSPCQPQPQPHRTHGTALLRPAPRSRCNSTDTLRHHTPALPLSYPRSPTLSAPMATARATRTARAPIRSLPPHMHVLEPLLTATPATRLLLTLLPQIARAACAAISTPPTTLTSLCRAITGTPRGTNTSILVRISASVLVRIRTSPRS